MERHSVPQNIMDVEFKLFGSLTVRQFANLASCIVAAVIFYFFDIPGVIKWPIIVGLVFLGLGLALVKINGQTFGTWLGNFVASMFSSQRKIWKKSPKIPEILTKTYRPQVSKEQLVAAKKKELPPFLREDIIQSTNVADKEEEERLKKLETYIYSDKNSSTETPVAKTENKSSQVSVVNPSDQNLAGTMSAVKEDMYSVNQSDDFAVVGKKMSNQKERPMSSRLVHKNLAENIGTAVSEDAGESKEEEKDEEDKQEEKKSTEEVLQKEGSSDELIEANKILQERIKELTEKAKKSPGDLEITKKLAEMEKRLEEIQSGGSFANEKIVSQKPNVISGIVIDKENNLLQEVRVLIKDRRGYLVRSLVTDKQGYFVTTTSLPDGDYLIELESDRYPFDQYKVNLDGSVKDTYKFTSR